MADTASLTLEQRLQRCEDYEQIRGLKWFYAHCADAKYTDDHRRKPQAEIDAITRRQVDRVFTEDAVWDGGPQFGARHGREAIYDHLRAGGWSFSLHYFLNPVIELDGDTARGSWLLWQPCTFEKDNLSVLLAAATDDEYVRTPIGWQMRRMQFTLKYITPYDQPWSKNRNALMPR